MKPMEEQSLKPTDKTPKGGDPAKLQQLEKKLKSFYAAQDTIPTLMNISEQKTDDDKPKQKLDDYYVKLENEVIDENKALSKQTIEIQQLFQIFANQPAPKNVIIKGNAGMGKTTFLSYFAYKWGKYEEFCQGKFDFVFKVPLKNLVKSIFLESTQKNFEILVSLITRQFSEFEQEKSANQTQTATLSKQEVKYILQYGENIVLLLDGFDEISGKYGNDESKNVKKVIDYVLGDSLKFKVLMTSRPNAIKQPLQKKFGRIIESKGLNLEEAKNYISKFFQSKPENGEALLKILHHNLSMVSVIQTPINLFMLCFVASENKEAVENFDGSFPLSDLYDQTLLWTTKRYKHKWDENPNVDAIQDLTIEDALDKNQVKILKNLAYQKFIEGKYQITSQEIKNQGKKINIQTGEVLLKVYRFGLLRMKGNGNKTFKESDLNDKEFDFVHLSFQEHLTASVLKEKLESSSDSVRAEAAKFIATHRNEPRYLMVLKILSGKINSQKNPTQKIPEQKKKLRELFWEAIVCNVDGILELGAETRIKLLMHLLSQCNVEDLLKQNINNINKIHELIDKEVMINLENWQAIVRKTNANLKLGAETKENLELGTEAKEKLQKYLRGQENADKLLQAKIPNIEQIYDITSKQIMRNLEKWSQSIISTGYLSKIMAKNLVEVAKTTNQFYLKNRNIDVGFKESKQKNESEESQQNFSRFKLVSKIIPHFMHKQLFNDKLTLLLLTSIDDQKNQMKNSVVLDNIYRIKNYLKMEDEDEFITFSKKIFKLFFYPRTQQLAMKVFYGICLSKESRFKNQDQISDHAFQQLKNRYNTFQNQNFIIKQILKLVRFHEAHSLNEKTTSAYLSKIKQETSEIIKILLKSQKVQQRRQDKMSLSSLFSSTDQSKYVYKNLKQILTVFPSLEEVIFEDIKVRNDWQDVNELPLYDLISIENKSLTDKVIYLLKHKKIPYNQTSWMIMNCSWVMLVNFKQSMKYKELEEFINFKIYFFEGSREITNKQYVLIEKALKKHPDLATLIIKTFQQNLPIITQDQSHFYGLNNVIMLKQALPQLDSIIILNNKYLCSKYRFRFFEDLCQLAAEFPKYKLQVNCLAASFVWVDHYYYKVDKRDFMIKQLNQISKQDIECLVKIYRFFIKSRDDKIRDIVIKSYQQLLKKQQSIDITENLFEQLLHLNKDLKQKDLKQYQDLKSYYILRDYLKLMTLILESAPKSNLKRKMLEQFQKDFEIQSNAQPSSRFYEVFQFVKNQIKNVHQQSEISLIIKLAESLINSPKILYSTYIQNSLHIWIKLITNCTNLPVQKCFNSIQQINAESDLQLFELKMRGFGEIAKKKSWKMGEKVFSEIQKLLNKPRDDKRFSLIINALSNVVATFPQIKKARDLLNYLIKVIQQNSTRQNYDKILKDVIGDNQFLAIRFVPYLVRQSYTEGYKGYCLRILLSQLIKKIPNLVHYVMNFIKQQIKASQNDKEQILIQTEQGAKQIFVQKKQYLYFLFHLFIHDKKQLIDYVEQATFRMSSRIFKILENNKDNSFTTRQVIIKYISLIKLPLKYSFRTVGLFKDVMKYMQQNYGFFFEIFNKFTPFMTFADAKYLLKFFSQDKFKILFELPIQQLIRFELIKLHASIDKSKQQEILKKYEKEISELQTEQDKHKDRYKKVAELVELSKIKALQNSARQVLFKIADDFKTPENLAESNSLTLNDDINLTPQQKTRFDSLPEKQKTLKLTELLNKKMIQRKVNFLNKLLQSKQDFSATKQTQENYSQIVESQQVRMNTDIPLARQFMKKVAHHLLSDDQITADDCQFIINCIKYDLTINVNKNGNIVLDDRTYSFDIKKNLQARKYFQKIVQTALKQDRELVKQYTTFEPYFSSRENLLTKSASDFKDIKSIVLPKKFSIDSNKNVLSWIKCKNNKNNVFCLVEKRSFFGDLLVYKIGKRNILSSFTCHPLVINIGTKNQPNLTNQEKQKRLTPLINFRKKIFGPLKDEEFEIISKEIGPEIEVQIQKLIRQKKKMPKINLCEQIKQEFFSKPINEGVKKKMWEIMGYAENSNEALHFRTSSVEKRLDQVEKNIQSIEKRLETSGTNDIAEINKTIEEYEKESPNLGMYYKVMYWTLNSYFCSFKSTLSGINQTDKRFDQEYGFMEEGFKAVGNMVLGLAEGIPGVGAFVGYLGGIIDYLTETYYGHKFQNKANSINKIIMDKVNSDAELSRITQKIVIEIIGDKKKKEIILNPAQDAQESVVQDFFDALRSDFQKLKSFFIEEEVSAYGDGDLVAKMATRDVLLLLAYMYKNSDKIVSNKEKQLHQQLAEGFKEQEKNLDEKRKYEEGEFFCCPIFRFEARYDNKILNHPDLIKLFLKRDLTADLIMHGDESKPREFLSKEE